MKMFQQMLGKRRTSCRNGGFSLIEVLVAMTILSVIVLIVAGIFQQTGLAWSLGLRRADEQSMIRAVAGSLTRDLSMMVDPANFVPGAKENDESLRGDALSEGGIDAGTGRFSNSGIDFWMLKPVDDITGDANVVRELVHVEYSAGGGSVTRKESYYTSGTGDPTTGNDARFNLGNGSVRFETLNQTSYNGYASLYEDGGIKIVVKPVTPESINDYEIAVGSCGPDGTWGTEDDIRTWVEGEDSN
ncbi:MAG: prepilin-type N-terminal cleavage/methylation domain-containing protein [Kiritimatiellae bacterium]|nr:prepilin-type N-terminal cleavage/methylation domain-containing protein [Kiritimatiellia bacterium]